MTAAADIHVEADWLAALAEAGLDSFEALYATDWGEAVSTHDRGWVRRVTLGDGRAVFGGAIHALFERRDALANFLELLFLDFRKLSVVVLGRSRCGKDKREQGK